MFSLKRPEQISDCIWIKHEFWSLAPVEPSNVIAGMPFKSEFGRVEAKASMQVEDQRLRALIQQVSMVKECVSGDR
jgi:hypothetical protein